MNWNVPEGRDMEIRRISEGSRIREADSDDRGGSPYDKSFLN